MQKTLSRFILFISLTTLSINLQAQFTLLLDVEDFKQKIKSITASTKTMSSDFVQEKHLSFMSEPIITEGQFLFMQPQKVRWEYQKPFSYVVIINQDELMIDDEGNQNKIDLSGNEMFRQINRTISSALMGDVLDADGQFESSIEESEKYYRINLVPIETSMKAYLQKMEVYFDKNDLLVSKVKLLESAEDFTNIIFSNKQINAKINADSFELK